MAVKRKSPEPEQAPVAAGGSEAAFPRGGGSILTPLEEKKLQAKAKAEVERELAFGVPTKSKRAKKGDPKAGDDEDTFFKSASTAGKLPKFVELLRFTNIAVGSKAWGTVQEVTTKRLVVSLPSGLRGYVSPDESSDVLRSLLAPTSAAADKALQKTAHGEAPLLTDLFYPGQFVRTVVLAVDDGSEKAAAAAAALPDGGKKGKVAKVTKKIHLTLRLGAVCRGLDRKSFPVGAVVPAVVRTVEDHGFVLDFGVKAVSGFLPRKDLLAALGPDATAKPGRVLEVVVRASERGGARLVVGCDPSTVSGTVTSEFHGMTLTSLLPGQLVTVTVRNVLSDGLLVSFLKYFHGTVDQFHLPLETLSSWRTQYEPNQRLQARILYIDPESKVIRLSLLRHLRAYHLPEVLPTLGDIYEEATVIRPDKSLGLLIELPTVPTKTLGYVHISNTGDDRTSAKLANTFPAGSTVRARVIGFRPLEGLATMTMKEAEMTGSLVTWKSLSAGAILEGTVHSIEDFGLVVQLGAQMRGVVPLAHVSEAAVPKKIASRFKPGQAVRARVMNFDAGARKVTLTLKKGLIDSKLPALASAGDAAPGTRAHGFVTGVTDKGIFVEFYNKVRGLVPPAEVSLAAGQTLQDAYTVGQVLKCTALGHDPKKGVRLTLRSAAAAAQAASTAQAAPRDPLAGIAVGTVLTGCTVSRTLKAAAPAAGADGDAEERVTACFLSVTSADGASAVARLEAAHFADHPYAADALAGALTVGAVLPEVLVLERREAAGLLFVTRKASLIAAAKAGALPSVLADLAVDAVVPGYIASTTADACYVRFAGGLTARAGLPQIADGFVTDPSAHFTGGQSVYARVLSVDAPASRFTVSLKPSSVPTPDPSALLASLFTDVAFAFTLTDAPEESAPALGSLTPVIASEQRDYGCVCDLEDHDLVGLIASAQVQATPLAPGAKLDAAVLDVQLIDGIVDLSVKQTLLDSCKKASKTAKAVKGLKAGDTVEAFVELVKDDPMYLVVTLPGHSHALAYLPSCDYNVQNASRLRTFQTGQKLTATVALVKGPGGRLLLTAPLATAVPSPKGAKGKAKPGAVVSGKVTAVHASHADLQIGKTKGRLHVTEVEDYAPDASAAAIGTLPLSRFAVGASVSVAVLGAASAAGAKVHRVVELSTRASALATATAGSIPAPVASWNGLAVGSRAMGAVQEVAADHLYVALSSGIRGRVHVLNAASDPAHLAAFRKSFAIGSMARCAVIAVVADAQRLDLSLVQDAAVVPLVRSAPSPKKGSLVMCQIKALSGRGVRVVLANGAIAQCALTDLHDAYVPNALEGLSVGTYARARVLGSTPGDSSSLRVSLKQSDGAAHAGHTQPEAGPPTPAADTPLALEKGAVVHAYVKSAQPAGTKGAGLYVTLSSTQDARVKLSLLADHYIDDPVAAFPQGRHVTGRLTDATPGRSELSLKSVQSVSETWTTCADLVVGAVVTGRVKRVERFGVFVDLADSNITGLAHVSELADTFMKDPAGSSRFAPGTPVRAVVLKKDDATGKVSLGLKPSYFAEAASASGDAAGAAGSTAKGGASAAAGEAAGGSGAGEDAMDLDAAMAAAYDESSDEESEDGSDGEAPMDVDAAADDDDSDGASSSGDDGDDAAEDDSAARRGTGASATTSSKSSGAGKSATLALPSDFGWAAFGLDDGAAAAGGASDEPETVASDGGGKGSAGKRARKRARETAEAEVRQAELARLDDAAPASVEDYERLCLASPNSSFSWIRYIAFLLSMSEVDAARAVSERALETIDYREQKEKFNVWLAMLSLENNFAEAPEEAAGALLQRALQYNDAKKMYLAAIDAFAATQRDELLANCVKALTRKFSASCKAWLKAYSIALAEGRDPKQTLDRATNALPMRKHVKFLSRAALMELKTGSRDRGRSMFESLLRAYPKRSDLWSVYIDQEVRVGDAAAIRNLFERTIHLELPPKKMKFFFKRYLDYETSHGSASTVAAVKQKAMNYIQTLPDK